jgi:hypothetical protein
VPVNPYASGPIAIAGTPATVAPQRATPVGQPDATLSGDGGTLVQEYGAVALVQGFQPLTAIPTAPAQPAVPSVDPVLPVGYRRIDTYA